MGGSGGVFSRSVRPEKVQQDIRREQERSRDAGFDIQVSTYLGELLARYNDRDAEAINGHLDALGSALQGLAEKSVRMLFGGSVAKHTHVDGVSDVDALVLLSGQDLAGKTPREVLADFGSALRQRFPQTQVREGTLAVTITFADGCEVQLLPAAKTPRGFVIPAPDGREWAAIKPQRFAEKLTQVNQHCGDKLVPTVKLAKALNESLPPERRLTGYHIESLAVEAFEAYSGPKTTKAMLLRFLSAASEGVRRPIVDRTGQSRHVDDYLGGEDDPRRTASSRDLLRMARRMRNADAAGSLDHWKALFGDVG